MLNKPNPEVMDVLRNACRGRLMRFYAVLWVNAESCVGGLSCWGLLHDKEHKTKPADVSYAYKQTTPF